MGQLTNYSENLLADFLRGSGFSSWPVIFYMGLASAATDGSVTELSGNGYARVSYGQSLLLWAGTQGSGTTLVSSGNTHTTSNNAAIAFATPGTGGWGTATHAVFYSAATAGNALIYAELTTSIACTAGATVSLGVGAIALSLGLTGGATDYLVNKLIDFMFRGQTYAAPANWYFALFTTSPTNAGGGIEVSGGNYSRPGIPANITALSSTNGPTTTGASTGGTTGQIFNNSSIAYPAPNATWGTVTTEGVLDAALAGNLLFYSPLTVPRTVLSASSPQTHAISTWSLTID